MPEPEFSSFDNIQNDTQNQPASPWVGMDMVDLSEQQPAASESNESKESVISALENRIRNEMSLEEISQLDIVNLPDAEYAAVKERLARYREEGNADPFEAPAEASTEAAVETPIEVSANTSPVKPIELSPEVKELKGKMANHPGSKEYAKNVVKKVAAILGIGALAAGMFFAGQHLAKGSISEAKDAGDGTQTEESAEAEEDFESLTGYDKLDKLINGSYEQDDNLGCFEADGKVSESSVGNPALALEEIGVDPANATAEERGVVSEYMAYSMKYPAAFQAIAYGLDGFEDLSLNEAEDKIANMSDEEKANLQKQLQEIYENSEYSEEVGQGTYRNHGVAGEKGDRHSFFVESDLTGQNILVRETKLADGTTVITREKEDCANMLDEIEYHYSNGATTVVKLNTPTDKPSKGNTPSNNDNPGGNTPGGGDTPSESLQPKNTAAEKKNAGSRVDQQPLDENVTPKTSLAEDTKPVQEAHEQVKSGNTAGSEAEKKQQAAVDNSAQTQQNNQEATSHADDTAAERAEAFENGDF